MGEPMSTENDEGKKKSRNSGAAIGSAVAIGVGVAIGGAIDNIGAPACPSGLRSVLVPAPG